MAHTNESAREQVLDKLAVAVDQLAIGLASLGEAYEEVDDRLGEALEQQLFRPTQAAYGRARRTHAEFAQRYQLPARVFEPGSLGLHSGDPRVHLHRALDAIEQADHVISELQDSMLPIEVGDEELRAGLSQTRALIAPLPAHARQLVRTLGR